MIYGAITVLNYQHFKGSSTTYFFHIMQNISSQCDEQSQQIQQGILFRDEFLFINILAANAALRKLVLLDVRPDRLGHLRARHGLLAADGRERLGQALRREDALAGLLHREGALGAGRLRRRARALLHRLPRVLRDLRARGLRRLRGLRDRRLRRRRHERWGVLPRAKLEPGPAHSSAALPAFCD